MSVFQKKRSHITVKRLVPKDRSYHEEYSCECQSSSINCSKVINKISVFNKYARLLRSYISHRIKNVGNHRRITHVKYQSSSTHCSRVINKVKIFKMKVKPQDTC